MRLSRHLGVCLLLLVPAAVRAEDIGPAQAQALQQQLRDWIGGLFGPSFRLPEPPWQIAGARDHYVLTWPMAGLTGQPGDPAAILSLRPLDAGRWSIDAMTMPPSGTFHVTLPPHGGGPAVPVDLSYTIGRQDTHGLLDPTLASDSSLRTELGDVVVTTTGTSQHQEERIESYRADTSLRPAANGRLDLAMDATMGGWKSASEIGGGAPLAIGAQTVHAVARVRGVNRERVTGLLAAIGGLLGALPAGVATQGDLPPAARAQLRLMVAALPDMLIAASLEESLDGVQVEIAGMGGASIRHLQFGFGGEAPDGRLHAWLDIGLDELASPSLPPKITPLLPHHVEVRPSLSGVSMADLHKLALDATEDGADSDSLAPDIAAIFSHGGIGVGIETLAFDLGPAKVSGTGSATVLSPGSWHAEAHLTATGLDDLANLVRTTPDLQQGLAALIMLRGLAKTDGGRLVWDIVSDGPTVTVNGLDLSQLGTEPPKPTPPAKRPGQPQRR